MSSRVSRKPAKATAKPLGCYLYAVIGAGGEPVHSLQGIDDATVYTIDNGRIAAVVSDVNDEKLRPERRRLAAHHEVLKRLMLAHTVLPMSFGMVSRGSEAIRKILLKNCDAFSEQLQRLAGKLEMGLHVFWDVPNFFEYFVDTHTELRLLRDQLFRGGREPTQEDKIELGRLFERALVNERQTLTEQVANTLTACTFEMKENKPRNEREVMNLACLIGRDAAKEFEQGVFAAAKFFDSHYAFDFNGPWPPHNFVEMSMQT